MDAMVSLKDARDYLQNLPRQLNEYLDDDYRRGLENLLERFEEFFNIVASDEMYLPQEAPGFFRRGHA